MKRLVLGLACLAAAGCSDAATFGDADRQAIEGALNAQQQAWNKGDIDAFMAGYDRSPDIVFTSGGTVRRGFDETLAKYKKSYGDPGAMGTLGFEVLELRGLGPDAAIMLGRWELTETPKAGAGVFSLVWRRTSAGWRVIHDHTSLDPTTTK